MCVSTCGGFLDCSLPPRTGFSGERRAQHGPIATWTPSLCWNCMQAATLAAFRSPRDSNSRSSCLCGKLFNYRVTASQKQLEGKHQQTKPTRSSGRSHMVVVTPLATYVARDWTLSSGSMGTRHAHTWRRTQNNNTVHIKLKQTSL